MRHAPEAKLRRLIDEPNAVADADAEHVERCHRCKALREQIVRDAHLASSLLSRPHPVPDIDAAWGRLERSIAGPARPERSHRRFTVRRHWRLIALPLPSTAALAGAAVLVAGAAAAAAFTNVFAPTHVVPVPVSPAEIQSLADVTGIDGSGVLGGFHSPSGSMRLPFGVVHWTSAGRAYRAASVAEADRASGIDLHLPAALPAGVGTAESVLVQPQVTATISFTADASPPLSGTSLRVTAGPAVLVEFGSSTKTLGLPTMAAFAMKRPLASSSAATSSQLEDFVLSRPGVPSGLAEEIRLLGDPGTTLPVPTPPGAHVADVTVGGSHGILISEGSGAASAVIWEDRGGVVHAVLGLLDEKDILHVADKLG